MKCLKNSLRFNNIFYSSISFLFFLSLYNSNDNQREIVTSQSHKQKIDPKLLYNKKRYDIFISFDGEGTLEHIKHENVGMKIKTFVDQYLVSEIKDMWRSFGYKGELAIFLEDIIHGSIDTAIFGGIKALQVLSNENG